MISHICLKTFSSWLPRCLRGLKQEKKGRMITKYWLSKKNAFLRFLLLYVRLYKIRCSGKQNNVNQNISTVTFYCKRSLGYSWSYLKQYFQHFTLCENYIVFYNTPILVLFVFPSECAQPLWVFPILTRRLAHVDYIMTHISMPVVGCRC